MKNNLQLFQFEKSNVRALEIDNEPWFVGKDVANILGYSNTRDALNKHVDSEDKNTVAIHDGITRGNPNQVIINESGLYSLILSSKMPNAKKFKHWVTSEVLPQIRKTGTYIPEDKKKRLSIMEDNSATRKANILYKIAMATESNSSKQTLLAKAAETITGEMTIPIMKEKEYSAGDIAKKLGTTATMVGKTANKLGLKAEQPGQNEYGRWTNSKSRFSDKEVPQWLYTEKGYRAVKKELEK